KFMARYIKYNSCIVWSFHTQLLVRNDVDSCFCSRDSNISCGRVDSSIFTFQGIKELVLPAITLGTASAALIARMSRSSMLEVIQSDYIRTARAKGVRQKHITWVHALRNSLIPVVTIIGINFGALLGGTIITEQVF